MTTFSCRFETTNLLELRILDFQCYIPIGTMHGTFTYIWLIFRVKEGRYPLHGWYEIHPSFNYPDFGHPWIHVFEHLWTSHDQYISLSKWGHEDGQGLTCMAVNSNMSERHGEEQWWGWTIEWYMRRAQANRDLARTCKFLLKLTLNHMK